MTFKVVSIARLPRVKGQIKRGPFRGLSPRALKVKRSGRKERISKGKLEDAKELVRKHTVLQHGSCQ